MAGNEKFNRRQFVKRTAVASGVVAASATLASQANACPIWFDDNGKIADWFCISDIDDSNPVYTLYTWKNCRTGEFSQSLGEPGMPLGNCATAPTDDSCYKGMDMEEWDSVSIGGSEYRIMPKTRSEVVAAAIEGLNRKH